MKNTALIIYMLLQVGLLSSQKYQYELKLEPVVIPDLGGLQSFSFGQHNGEWLIIGGRLDGLHQRQPFAAFTVDGNNAKIMVVNPLSKKVWSSSVNTLPAAIKEQLSSTNMQFIQEGTNLLLSGGYGYSATSGDHITFPNITLIDIPALIDAIKNQQELSPYIVQIEDQKFAVTGGRIAKMNNIYYLVGGHKFMGRYNPMGPTHGPGFVQEYTYEARPFTFESSNGQLTVTHYPAIHDEMNLRRRDYNLMPQMKNNQEELMVFSGVFQPSADVPWLYPIGINEQGLTPHTDFTQHFNHYHCATLPIYNASDDEMHNLFFGGIAQFYQENGLLVQDNDVPFVKTIADVTRLTDGTMVERIHTEEMPDLLGAGSEMILVDDAPLYPNGVINGELLTTDPTTIGYIYGGIKSSMPNVFWINTGAESEASSTVFKILLTKTILNKVVEHSALESSLLIYPNPAQKTVRIAIDIKQPLDINIEIFDLTGNKVDTQTIDKTALVSGKNYLVLNKTNINYGAYLYKIHVGNDTLIRKVIWME